MPTYTKLKDDQWVRVREKTKGRYIRDIIGTRPTIKSVAEDLPNPYMVSILEWVAMVVLLILTIVTSFKVFTVAIPFSEQQIAGLADYVQVSPLVSTFFAFCTGLLFIMMATPALIYFKLLDSDPGIVANKEETKDYPWIKRLSLDYVSPRLPYLIVYISMVWLITVSTHGANYSGKAWWAQLELALERYLPVILEVGLAHLVGTVLLKRSQFQSLVRDEWKLQVKPWDTRLKSRENDPEYNRILFHVMREGMIAIRRKKSYPNAWMEGAEPLEVQEVIVSEYRRLHAGLDFAKAVTDLGKQRIKKIQTIKNPRQAVIGINGRRMPPKGDKFWTVATLTQDFNDRGLTPQDNYTEGQLSLEYEPNYDARKAFRGGARGYFDEGMTP